MGVVIATAGHVDHGKSSLVKALTGMNPDRLKDEKQRGLTIELGFAWADFAEQTIAFVDVPGHEKFITTMLAGVGAVPIAMLVVGANDGWMPQTQEHLNALNALEVHHGVVVITRCDLADPTPVREQVQHHLAGSTLARFPIVETSSLTGQGITELHHQLTEIARNTPTPPLDADVRLWVDRKFHVEGVGTVITATLPAGTITTGMELHTPSGRVRVRGIESLNTAHSTITGPARVALNLTGGVEHLRRGTPLWNDNHWYPTQVVDIRIRAREGGDLPRNPMWHMGAHSTQVRLRMLDETHAQATLPAPLPLRQGDHVILRNPGNRDLWGGVVLDPAASRVRGLGQRQRRVDFLRRRTTTPSYTEEVARFGAVTATTLRQLGIHPPTPQHWHLDERWKRGRRNDIYRLITNHDQANPTNPGMPPTQVITTLNLPVPADVVTQELLDERLRVDQGRITSQSVQLPPQVLAGLRTWLNTYQNTPFQAPTLQELRAWGLGEKELAAAARLKQVFLPAPGVVLPPQAARLALDVLKQLPQPFTTSQARKALGTSRRVAIPLLEFFDRAGITRRLVDDRREITARG